MSSHPNWVSDCSQGHQSWPWGEQVVIIRRSGKLETGGKTTQGLLTGNSGFFPPNTGRAFKMGLGQMWQDGNQFATLI